VEQKQRNEKVSTISSDYLSSYYEQEIRPVVSRRLNESNNEVDQISDEDIRYSRANSKPYHARAKPKGRQTASQYLSHPHKATGSAKKRQLETMDEVLAYDGIDNIACLALHKLKSQDILSKIGGCLAQGKEAIIHHAVGGKHAGVTSGAEYAVKIYRTSKIEFRDREQYIEGEWRFRCQKMGNSPMKMNKLWAEKELRNLKRLKSHGIPCPDPIMQRGHMLILSFIGEDGFPSPHLEQVRMSKGEYAKYYWECAALMRNMYQLSGLVHADLSPYNILVHKGSLYFIDLAQAVTRDHKLASNFLRRDCFNMTKFFTSRKTPDVMQTKQLFDFITNPTIDSQTLDQHIEGLKNKLNDPTAQNLSQTELLEEQLWLNINLPRSIKDVKPELLLEDGIYFSAFSNVTSKIVPAKVLNTDDS